MGYLYVSIQHVHGKGCYLCVAVRFMHLYCVEYDGRHNNDIVEIYLWIYDSPVSGYLRACQRT